MSASRAWRRFKAWSLPGKVVAVAGAIGALAGAARAGIWVYDELKPEPEPPAVTQFERTPQLGLEFWQDGRLAPMRFTRIAGYRADGARAVGVSLAPAPFRLRLPRGPIPPEVCAWTSPTLLRPVRQDLLSEHVPCLRRGRGMADAEFASGRLILTPDAKTYLDGNRLQPIGGHRSQAYFSETSPVFGRATSLRRRTAPIYLIVYRDANRDRFMQVGDYEAIRLDF